MIKQYRNILLIFLFTTTFESNTQPLRVLFCLRRFPTNTAWFIVNQIVAFIEQGHDVTIYTQYLDTESINSAHPDICAYNLLEKTSNIVPKQKNFDLILCQSAFLAPHIIALKNNNELNGKLVIFIREAFKDILIEEKQTIFKKADLILPVCEFFKNHLISLGCNEKKIVVLHSAIDLTKFQFKKRTLKNNEPIHLITVSRLNEKKGVHYVIQAIKLLIKKYPTIQYTVLGDGSYRPVLERLIKQLNLEKHVHLVGWKTPQEVRRTLMQSHIFVLASTTSARGHQEGIPNALMEACATGLPVISTWHAGIPELIKHEVSGYLVEEKSSQSLARALDYILTHTEIWSELGRAGRQEVEKNFDRTIENKKLITLCEKLVTHT